MPNKPKGNIRYRLSPEVAAELALLRNGGGYRSWDDFFTAMARKWRQPTDELTPSGVKAGFKLLHAELKELGNLCRNILREAEGQAAILESLHSTQEQTHVLLQQFTALLFIAFGEDELSKGTSAPSGSLNKLQKRIRKRSG